MGKEQRMNRRGGQGTFDCFLHRLLFFPHSLSLSLTIFPSYFLSLFLSLFPYGPRSPSALLGFSLRLCCLSVSRSVSQSNRCSSGGRLVGQSISRLAAPGQSVMQSVIRQFGPCLLAPYSPRAGTLGVCNLVSPRSLTRFQEGLRGNLKNLRALL